MDEFKNAYFFRGFAGLLSVVGLLLLVRYWSILYPLSASGLLGACYAIAIASTIVSSCVYCVVGRWWYLSFTSLLFLLVLYFAQGAFEESGQSGFCQEFARNCLQGTLKSTGDEYFCTSRSELERFKRMCSDPG